MENQKQRSRNFLVISLKINDISFVKIKRNKIGAIAKKFLKKANCVVGYKFPNDLTITP